MSTATLHMTDTEKKVLQAAHEGKISFTDGVKAESQIWESEMLRTLHDELMLANAAAKRVVNSLIKKEMIIRLETEESEEGNMLELTDHFVDQVNELDAVDEDADLVIEDDEDEDEDDKPTTMIQAAAKKRKASNDKLKAAAVADGQASRRTSHANCDHATQGSEGKKARAACRRERAAAEAAKAVKAKK